MCARGGPDCMEHMSGHAKVKGLSRIQSREYTATNLPLREQCTTTNTCKSAAERRGIRAV